MLREVIVSSTVVKNRNENREITTGEIAACLLKQLSYLKACKYGYFLAVTKLINIGSGDTNFSPQHINIPVNFLCKLFIPVEGEVADGVVHKVLRCGVFIRAGLMNIVYLSGRMMPNYSYVVGDNPSYVGEDLSRIEIGVLVRFRVFGAKWVEDKDREFRVLASIDGDGLGPVSMNGFDGVDL